MSRFGLAICAFSFAACMPHFQKIDTGKPLTDSDLALAFSKSDNNDADDFSEQLVVRARLEDEASIYVKLTVTNLATADGRADLIVNVDLPDGRQLKLKQRKDRDEWSYAKDRFMAEVGDGKIEVGVGWARVVAENDEFAVDFEVTSQLPALRPQGGLYDHGGRFYLTTIPIPRGKARARVTVRTPPEDDDEEDDEDDEVAAKGPGSAPAGGQSYPYTVELEGAGYAEHRAGNVAPYVLARRWYSILDISEERTVLLSVFEHAPPEGTPRDPQAKPGPVQGFFFASNDEAIELYEGDIDLSVRGWHIDEKTSYPTPKILFVNAREQRSSFEGVIVAGALSERKDDLRKLSRLERIVVRKFMKPWTFRFDRARFLFRRQDPGEPMREVRGAHRLQVQQLN